MASLRTIESENIFQEFRKNHMGENTECVLCRKPSIKDFKFWKLVTNDFPYDTIASVHHMIAPLRHVTEEEFTADELKELKELKDTVLNDDYEYIIEATHRKKSIPAHFHLHLIVSKE